MAARSPSPNPSRPINPNPKTPDSNNLRRSGSFNLSKPSTPSEFSHRNSGSKGLRASFEQKENEMDPNCLKPARAKSPAVSSSKASKNFMSPTISASSKVVAASPRKKILAERNEMTPDAVKVSSVSAEGVGLGEIGPKSDMGFGSGEILGGMELGKVDSKIKNHYPVAVPSISPPPVVAPLDADPSFPPYDPKTNYLSPRPRFLHYKPNPRLNKEVDLLEVGDGKQLDDSFSSESCEDLLELTEEAQSSCLQKDSEEVLSAASTEMDEEECVEDTHAAEPEFTSKPSVSVFRSWSSRRLKLVPLLLVLAIACLYAPLTDTPIILHSTSEDQSLAKLYTPSSGVFQHLHLIEYLSVANVNLQGLANRFRHWSIDSVAYFTSRAFLPGVEFGLFDLANLTSSTVYEFVDSSSLETETKQSIKESRVEEDFTEEGTLEEELKDLEDVKESEAEENEMDFSEYVKEESSTEEGAVERTELKNLEYVKEGDRESEAEEYVMDFSESVKEVDVEHVAVQIQMEVCEDVKEALHPVDMEMKIQEDDGKAETEQEQSQPGNEALHFEEEVGKYPVLESAMEATSIVNSLAEIQPAGFGDSYLEDEEHQPSYGPKEPKVMNYGGENKVLMLVVLGMSAAAAVLAATLAFCHTRQKQTPIVMQEKLLPPKKVGSVSASCETYVPANGTPCQNLRGDVEIVGDSGPSEVSSSLNHSSSFGRLRTKESKEEESLSYERRLRRDSTASSISYGSFTTYEKLSAKKGGKDEEVVTPVRRSSRIRNLVTSP